MYVPNTYEYLAIRDIQNFEYQGKILHVVVDKNFHNQPTLRWIERPKERFAIRDEFNSRRWHSFARTSKVPTRTFRLSKRTFEVSTWWYEEPKIFHEHGRLTEDNRGEGTRGLMWYRI